MTETYDKPMWQFGKPVDTSEGVENGVFPDVTRILNALRDLYPQSLFDELRDHQGRGIRREFALYSAADINAFASRHQNTYVFGLCGGLCDAFRHAARSLLSHPRLFPDVGDPTKEVSQDVGSVLLRRSGDSQPKLALPPGPRCLSRALYAEAMVSAMIYYVMHHEFLHFYYGHVDFFGRGQAYPIILESAGRNDLATRSDVYRHISELEADGGAWRSASA